MLRAVRKLEPFIIDGERYLCVEAAARIVRGFSRPTIDRWLEQGETSFHLKLGPKKSRLSSTETTGVMNIPRKIRATREPWSWRRTYLLSRRLPKPPGRTEPRPWSPHELATLEAKAAARVSRRIPKSLSHLTRLRP